MGTQINVGRTINDTEGTNKFEFVVPDMLKMMTTPVRCGDEFMIPVSIRDNRATIWEIGGRNENIVSSIGTIITNERDQLLDAILFNKLNIRPNGKQALVALKSGYHLYAGRISVRKNELAPKIKIIRFIYSGIDKALSNDKCIYGRFVVDALFTDYGSIDTFPAKRLVEKLYTKDVIKPYFVNGWSISNISRIKDRDQLKNEYARILAIETPVKKFIEANEFLDSVEDAIVLLKNQNLSAVFQHMDFETGTLVMKPLIDMALSDIPGTIEKANATQAFSIPILNMAKCYNQSIMFGSNDIPMLEVTLGHDEKYAISTKSRTFSCLRGYRG
jgi:hypothetical protein